MLRAGISIGAVEMRSVALGARSDVEDDVERAFHRARLDVAGASNRTITLSRAAGREWR